MDTVRGNNALNQEMKTDMYKIYEHTYADTEEEFMEWYDEVRSTTHSNLANMGINQGEKERS